MKAILAKFSLRVLVAVALLAGLAGVGLAEPERDMATLPVQLPGVSGIPDQWVGGPWRVETQAKRQNGGDRSVKTNDLLPQLYALELHYPAADLCLIDQSAGAITSRIPVGFNGASGIASGIAYDWQDDVLYVLCAIDNSYWALGTLDRTTGEVTLLGPLWAWATSGVAGGIPITSGIACDPNTGTLYVIIDDVSDDQNVIGKLCQINRLTGEVTLVCGPLVDPDRFFNGAYWPINPTCDPSGGVWVTDVQSLKLMKKIDVATATLVSPPHYGWLKPPINADVSPGFQEFVSFTFEPAGPEAGSDDPEQPWQVLAIALYWPYKVDPFLALDLLHPATGDLSVIGMISPFLQEDSRASLWISSLTFAPPAEVP